MKANYLSLMHGRDAPDEALSDWGFTGPIVGPVELHWTYGTLSMGAPGSGCFMDVARDDLVVTVEKPARLNPVFGEGRNPPAPASGQGVPVIPPGAPVA